MLLSSFGRNQWDSEWVEWDEYTDPDPTIELGLLDGLNLDIIEHILLIMDVETVVRLSTTSKGWLRATTSDRIWHKKLRLDLDYPADYRPSDRMLFDEYRLCKAFEERLKSGEIFTTEDFITVDDGEAVIESVSGLGSGLIIKKQPIAYSWDDRCGTVVSLLCRLTNKSSENVIRDSSFIDFITRTGRIPYDSSKAPIADAIEPLMKLFSNATYQVKFQSKITFTIVLDLEDRDYHDCLPILIAFSSGGVYSGYSDVLVMTQRMAELNRERIEFYKDRFRQGLPCIIIVFRGGGGDMFVLDGHHKIISYIEIVKEVPTATISALIIGQESEGERAEERELIKPYVSDSILQLWDYYSDPGEMEPTQYERQWRAARRSTQHDRTGHHFGLQRRNGNEWVEYRQ